MGLTGTRDLDTTFAVLEVDTTFMFMLMIMFLSGHLRVLLTNEEQRTDWLELAH